MAVAVAAVVIALGGTSYAAIVVTGKTVKNGSLTGKDVKNRSLTAADIRKPSGLRSDELLAGPRGPQGAQGARGAQGAPGGQGAQGLQGAAGDPGAPGATNVLVREGPSMTALPAATASASASCQSGERATGGGSVNSNTSGVYLKQSYPTPLNEGATPTGWTVDYQNTTSFSTTIKAWVVCASP